MNGRGVVELEQRFFRGEWTPMEKSVSEMANGTSGEKPRRARETAREWEGASPLKSDERGEKKMCSTGAPRSKVSKGSGRAWERV